MGQEIDKKQKNSLFMAAVDYLYKKGLVGSQGELAIKIGISEAALSRIKNNKKTVSDDTLRKMNEAFGGVFNMAYFRGVSSNLLIEDETYYQQHPDEDPLHDFDNLLKKRAASATPVTPAANVPDLSSTLNASISAYVQLTNRLSDDLKRKEQDMADRLADKDTIIAEKSARIATLESLLKEKDTRILDLQRQLAAARASDLTGYPFPIGAAEKQENRPNI